MVPLRSVTTCRWSRPTLFLPWPLWCEAAGDEWSCTIGPSARPLRDPSECRCCPRWAPDGAVGRDVAAPADLPDVASFTR